jgi:hypothetical protein
MLAVPAIEEAECRVRQAANWAAVFLTTMPDCSRHPGAAHAPFLLNSYLSGLRTPLRRGLPPRNGQGCRTPATLSPLRGRDVVGPS